jgi:hypothetical protein
MGNNEDVKRDRFVRIVERRVEKAIDALDAVGKCSNRRNYQYSQADVKKIFGALETKLKEIKHMFQGEDPKRGTFKL